MFLFIYFRLTAAFLIINGQVVFQRGGVSRSEL